MMRVFDFKQTFSLLIFFGVFTGFSDAYAVTTLKQVQVSGGSEVDLLFDGKIARSQIHTEFFNDIVQVSLSDVSVYPAKISSVNGGALTKVFAYQYAPKMVRCRFSVKGKAEDFKDRVKVSPNGKILTVRIEDLNSEKADSISSQAAAPMRGDSASQSVSKVSEKKAPIVIPLAGNVDHERPTNKRETVDLAAEVKGTEERDLLDRVMAAPVVAPAVQAQVTANRVERGSSKSPVTEKPKPLTGAKPLPSFLGVFLKLGIVLGLFGIIAFLMRRFLGNSAASSQQEAGIVGAISRYARTSLGKIAVKEKMIEVLSTHYLGPKKSIVVARVCGRVLVLGVSNDSISLITQLAGDAEFDFDEILGGTGATAAGPAVFSDLLTAEKSRPSLNGGSTLASSKPVSPAVAAAAQDAAIRSQNSVRGYATAGPAVSQHTPGVRAQIRSRLEGLKPL